MEIAADGATTPSADGEEVARGVTLNPQERQVHALVDGKRAVQEIVERSPLGEFETCRILYELLGRQLIEEVRVAAPRAAPAAEAATSIREVSPLLLGIGYLLLILAAGGSLLYRARTCVAAWSSGGDLAPCLDSVIRSTEVRELRESIARARLQRVDFALQVYYLLNRGFPSDLHYLVTTHLLSPQAIEDPWGHPFLYEVKAGGYRLVATPQGDGAEAVELDYGVSIQN